MRQVSTLLRFQTERQGLLDITDQIARRTDAQGFADGRLALGTWRGIYLFEHRRRPHARTVALHLLGE